jgi:hypothetical protein
MINVILIGLCKMFKDIQGSIRELTTRELCKEKYCHYIKLGDATIELGHLCFY